MDARRMAPGMHSIAACDRPPNLVAAIALQIAGTAVLTRILGPELIVGSDAGACVVIFQTLLAFALYFAGQARIWRWA